MEDAPGLPGSIPVGDTAPHATYSCAVPSVLCTLPHLHVTLTTSTTSRSWRLSGHNSNLNFVTLTPQQVVHVAAAVTTQLLHLPSPVGGWVKSSTPPTPLAHQHMAIQLGSAAGALTYGAIYTIRQYVGAQYCAACGWRERSGWGGGGGGKLVCVICTCRSR